MMEKTAGVRAVHVVAVAGTEIQWQGKEVAAVAADTEEIARDAVRKIKVEYEVMPHFVDTSDPSRHIEVFLSESWMEHLRQHERVTVSDRAVQEALNRFLVDGGADPGLWPPRPSAALSRKGRGPEVRR